jgi:hypothetical protein
MRATKDKGPDLAWSALFVVASVLGGLAAADITHESTLFAVIFSLMVAIIMMFALQQGLLDRTHLAAGQPAGRRDDEGSGVPHGDHGGQRAGPTSPVQPIQPGAVRLMQPQSADGTWWKDHVVPAGRNGSPAAPPDASLAQFLDQALIAQCPHCGAFRIDADNRAAELKFRCQECRRQWTWQPGRPWPAIQVRPDAREREDGLRG